MPPTTLNSEEPQKHPKITEILRQYRGARHSQAVLEKSNKWSYDRPEPERRPD